MDKYLPVMTEAYRRKHYGNGVFAALQKKTAGISFLIYIFFGVVLAGGVYGAYWCVQNTKADFVAGDPDMKAIGYGMAAICAVFALVALLCLIITICRNCRGPEQWKKYYAKKMHYTVEDMNVFEHQALEYESRVISLVGAFTRTTSGQSDGIITRDYIYLSLGDKVILKLSDVIGACLIEQTVGAGRGTKKTGIDFLMISVMGKGGYRTMAECTRESGMALVAYLKEKCPKMYAEEEILEGDEYQKLWEELKSGKQLDN